MKKQWAPGFTIVELLIVIVSLAVLSVMCIFGYNSIRHSAATRATQHDLRNISVEMAHTKLKTGTYPTAVPNTFQSSPGINITLVESGDEPLYSNISPVQNGILFAQICAELVTEGVGKGPNQAGEMQDYITGCGNWNHDSMQFTGWNSKLWNTPVTSEQLLTYANTFSVSDAWNKSEETVTKTFYNTLIHRFTRQGGAFPITSFWDYWATPQNGGVIPAPLETNPPTRAFFCVEATSTQYNTITWHITEEEKLTEGAC